MTRLREVRRRLAGGPPVVLVALFGLLGFLLVTASSSATAVRRAEAPRRTQLAELIQARRAQVEELDAAVAQLRSRVKEATAAATSRSEGDTELADTLAGLGELAGTSAMRGPGVEVRLADSTRRPREGEDEGAYRVHDRDVQLIVNALFASGAEAVAVNDIRLVATSPIRAAGATIVVSFRPLNPPYVIKAIGADRERFAATEESRLYNRWHDVFGLGFRVRSVDDLTVPAYTGRVSVGAAAPL